MAVDQEEIHRLSLSENVEDRFEAARLLQEEFESLPDKSAAWDDIHRLINDTESSIKEITAYTLGYFFKNVPEESKSIAWDDLVRLLEQASVDNEFMLSRQAANALCFAFEYVPNENKPQAWFYLTKIPVDGHFIDVIDDVASSLRYLFVHIPNKYKSQAWTDLFRLMSADNTDVKYSTVSALSYVYSSVPDKNAVWTDFNSLINDKDSYVRMYANHSLGKICISRASKSDNVENSRALLKDAIQYFDKAANEESWENPAKFCNLFYRSFNAIIFEKTSSRQEIESYIAGAKKEIGSSKSKQKLIEAVEQLAEVLKTAQNASEGSVDYQVLLRSCSVICNHVDKLIDENKEKTPAIHELYKRAKQSFDITIKKIIEIREKAEEACTEAKGEYKQAACGLKFDLNILNYDELELIGQVDNILYIALVKTKELRGLEQLQNKINDAIESTDKDQKLEALKIYAVGLNIQPTIMDRFKNPVMVAGFIGFLLQLTYPDIPTKNESILILIMGLFILTLVLEW